MFSLYAPLCTIKYIICNNFVYLSFEKVNMKTRTILITLAILAAVACGQQRSQTPAQSDNADTLSLEEKVKEYDGAVTAMESGYYAMRDSLAGDIAAWNKYSAAFMDEYAAFNIDAAKKNLDNEIALKALMNLRGLISDEESAAILDNLSSEMKENEHIKSLKAGLDARIATAEGKMFVDFTVNSVVAQTRSIPPQPIYGDVKLSDYVGKGKYILLDFWSPWCGPCKREMPNIKAVYDKYMGDNFDVVSIAVWEKEPVDVTIRTAAELGMDWNQINNGQREPAQLYGVEGIPHLILFGPDGTILKRGFHGAEIEQVVSSYLK